MSLEHVPVIADDLVNELSNDFHRGRMHLELQADSRRCCEGSVGLLVHNQRRQDERGAVPRSLLQAQHPRLRHEQSQPPIPCGEKATKSSNNQKLFFIRTQEVLLRQPRPDHHVVRYLQPLHWPLEFPKNPLGQLGKCFDEDFLHGERHGVTRYGAPETEVNESSLSRFFYEII